MRKLYALTLLSYIIVTACRKSDPAIEFNTDDLINNAKRYFEKAILPSSSFIQTIEGNGTSPVKGARTVVWEKATAINFGSQTAVLAPIHYTTPFIITTNLNKRNLYECNDLVKLLIYKDQYDKYHTELVTILPDSNYSIQSRTQFSGLLLIQNWAGNAIRGYKFENSGMVREIKTEGATNSSRQSVLLCLDYYGYNYSPVTGEYYYWSYSGGCYSVGAGDSYEDSYSGGYGGDYGGVVHGGGGGSGSYPQTNSFTVVSGDNVIGNISDYLKCFDNNPAGDHQYQVTICVDQPKPFSRDPWTVNGSQGSSNNPVYVGHTFLVLNETTSNKQITRNVGFYPKSSVWPYSPATQGELNNDANHSYDVSLTITMTSSQFYQVLDFISQGNNAGYQYNLNSNNCTTFAINALAVAGFNLPKTNGNWSGGSGLNPGDLGEDIRAMDLSSNMTRSTVYNYHPNVGECY